MANFLEQYQDPTMHVNMQWEPDATRIQHYDRLIDTGIMGWLAYDIPKRLGGDATREALAQDKRFSKKVAHRCASLANAWSPDGNLTAATFRDWAKDAEPELRTHAAQIEWLTWWSVRQKHLRSELTFVATHGLRTGNVKIANRFANRLINELTQLEQVFKEL